MKLYLLRHAEASYDAPSDEARELTPKGRKSIEKLARNLDPAHWSELQAIHHSGLVRARQTAELFQQHLGLKAPVTRHNHLRPEDDPGLLVTGLLNASRDVFLTGHNPHLSHLTALLLTGNPATPCINFKKCGLLCLERLTHSPGPQHPAGLWALRWFVVPKIG